MPSGSFIDSKFEHFSNVSEFILVTELGMVMDFKLVQFLNAPSPILFTELGIDTVGKDLQPENA